MKTMLTAISNTASNNFFSCGYSKRISAIKEVRATFASNLKKVFYF
ncbi:MAG: hypothetical protein R3Y23_02975 [Bacillota bacterium]